MYPYGNSGRQRVLTTLYCNDCVIGNTESESGRLLSLGNAHVDHVILTNHNDVTAQYATPPAAVRWTGSDVIKTTTVRDLEQAMKRHLPATIGGHSELVPDRRHRRRHWTPYHVTSQLLPASDLLRTLHDAAVRRQQHSVICSPVTGRRH